MFNQSSFLRGILISRTFAFSKLSIIQTQIRFPSLSRTFPFYPRLFKPVFVSPAWRFEKTGFHCICGIIGVLKLFLVSLVESLFRSVSLGSLYVLFNQFCIIQVCVAVKKNIQKPTVVLLRKLNIFSSFLFRNIILFCKSKLIEVQYIFRTKLFVYLLEFFLQKSEISKPD